MLGTQPKLLTLPAYRSQTVSAGLGNFSYSDPPASPFLLSPPPLSAFCKMLAPNTEGWKVRSSRRSDEENAALQANQVTLWKIVS